MRVSVALIVKNGAATLPRCLAGLQGAVDEIIVVDTGSTDDTKFIAARYGARVFDFPWGDDFSAARQFAFDQATGDWVAWVDADDAILHAERIRPMVASAAPGTGAFWWPYIYARDAFGNAVLKFWRERCVRNDGSFRWAGRVHEVLVADAKWERVYSDDVVVEHHKQPAEERGRNAPTRNLDILEHEYAESGGVLDPRPLFYLARERADTGNLQGAIRAYREYLRVGTWEAERYTAQTEIAALYRRLGRYQPAIRADLDALAIRPEWPDAYFGLAASYYFVKDWAKVLHWADLGRCMPEPDQLPLIFPMRYRYDWIIYYTNALSRTGDLARAEEWTRRALELRPDATWHLHNMQYFAGAHAPRTWESDEICYYASHGGPHLFAWSPTSVEDGLGGSEIAVIELSRTWQAQGYRVTVFGDPRQAAGEYDGVTYRPWYDMRWQDRFNILVLWRYPHHLDRRLVARKVFVDLHDVPSANDWTAERLARVDRVFFKSNTHRAQAPYIPDEKTAVIGNGW